MDSKEKLITQGIICCMVFVCAKGLSFLPGERAQTVETAVMQQLQKHYTEDDLKHFAEKVSQTVKETPAAIAHVVTRANSAAESLETLVSAQAEQLQPVYAPADGVVLTSGIDERLGMVVKLQHEKQVMTCGNLCRVSVVEKETVQKGDIIGYYDKTCGKRFYYDEQENDRR